MLRGETEAQIHWAGVGSRRGHSGIYCTEWPSLPHWTEPFTFKFILGEAGQPVTTPMLTLSVLRDWPECGTGVQTPEPSCDTIRGMKLEQEQAFFGY